MSRAADSPPRVPPYDPPLVAKAIAALLDDIIALDEQGCVWRYVAEERVWERLPMARKPFKPMTTTKGTPDR